MSDHHFCRALLVASRADLKKHPKLVKRLKGMHTWSTSYGINKYFEVWVGSKIVWQGTAHCAYEAKSNAILKFLPEK